MTPLHFAALLDKTEVVNLLLKAGASLSVVNNKVIKP
jgi:ankyrin repeat protein